MVRRRAFIVLCLKLGWLSLTAGACGSTSVDEPPEGIDLDPDRGRPTSAIVDFDLGAWTGCSAHADGSVYCWGVNIHDFSVQRPARWNPTPIRITGVEGAVDVTVGMSWACALDNAGKVTCWGYTGEAETGNAHEFAMLRGAVEIDADTSMLCGRFSDGRVRCHGTFWDSGLWYDIRDLNDATSISVGGDYGCAVRADTTAVCWGRFLQETGLPQVHDLPNAIVDEEGTAITGIAAVEASAGLGGLPPSTYLVMADGRILAMGANEDGQLGAATHAVAMSPLPVSLNAVQSASAGQRYACALTRDATVSCWGRNDLGMLGNGSPGQSAPPSPLALEAIERIEAGDNTACALTDARLWCWGSNADFLLGTRAPGPEVLTPTLVPETAGVTSASLNLPWQSVDPRACFVTSEGSLFCGGQDESTESFDGEAALTFTGVTHVSLGPWHACAVREDKTVWCWGHNFFGQLGVEQSYDGTKRPVQAVGVASALKVGVSEMGSCALLEDGGVSCWGTGPVVSAPFDSPTLRDDVRDAVDLSVSGSSACAVIADGSALCWGGLIQHPSGAAVAFESAVRLPAPEPIDRVTADDSLACVLGKSGALYCWRGLGSFPYEAYPGPPPFPTLLLADSMPNLVAVDAADGRVCGVTAEGKVWCMQEFPDDQGELPTGALPKATQIEGIDDAVDIVVAFGATCAITPRGLVCWGEVPFAKSEMISASPVPLDY